MMCDAILTDCLHGHYHAETTVQQTRRECYAVPTFPNLLIIYETMKLRIENKMCFILPFFLNPKTSFLATL